MFIIKNRDTTKLMIQFLAKIQDKKTTSFTISKTIFSPKGCLLFLNKDS